MAIEQWRSKVGVGPCAKIPKGPIVLLTEFVSLQCEQAIPIIWQFLGWPKVCHTSKSQAFPVISDETNYCRLVYKLFKKNLIHCNFLPAFMVLHTNYLHLKLTKLHYNRLRAYLHQRTTTQCHSNRKNKYKILPSSVMA